MTSRNNDLMQAEKPVTVKALISLLSNPAGYSNIIPNIRIVNEHRGDINVMYDGTCSFAQKLPEMEAILNMPVKCFNIASESKIQICAKSALEEEPEDTVDDARSGYKGGSI